MHSCFSLIHAIALLISTFPFCVSHTHTLSLSQSVCTFVMSFSDPHCFNLFLWGVRFVLSLETDLTVRAKTTEIPVNDFSSGSYATIFREEVRFYELNLQLW